MNVRRFLELTRHGEWVSIDEIVELLDDSGDVFEEEDFHPSLPERHQKHVLTRKLLRLCVDDEGKRLFRSLGGVYKMSPRLALLGEHWWEPDYEEVMERIIMINEERAQAMIEEMHEDLPTP